MKWPSAHSTARTAMGRDARGAAREIRGALVACVSDAVLAACGAWRASILARRTYRSHDDGLALATGKAAGSAVVTAL
jgi:hypothetical protein